jgi:hypothetical protein
LLPTVGPDLVPGAALLVCLADTIASLHFF